MYSLGLPMNKCGSSSISKMIAETMELNSSTLCSTRMQNADKYIDPVPFNWLSTSRLCPWNKRFSVCVYARETLLSREPARSCCRHRRLKRERISCMRRGSEKTLPTHFWSRHGVSLTKRISTSDAPEPPPRFDWCWRVFSFPKHFSLHSCPHC